MELAPIISKYAPYVFDASPDHSWGFPEIADLAADQVRDPLDRSALRAAIATTLAADLDNEELNRLWSKTNAGIKFKKDGARRFLTEWLFAIEHETHRYSL